MKGVAVLLLIANTNAITLQSDPMFSSLGYETRHYKGEGDYDDYTVPHFGEDHEITYTKKNIAAAEKALGHVIDTSPPPDDPPRNYFVPHFGTDEDIKSSLKNLAAEEKTHGAWNLSPDDYFQ